MSYENVEIETRGKSTADILNARLGELTQTVKTTTGEAERNIGAFTASAATQIGNLASSSTNLIASRLEQLNTEERPFRYRPIRSRYSASASRCDPNAIAPGSFPSGKNRAAVASSPGVSRPPVISAV